jgi:pimeloyl-ACP methyl ester carboxylesterase
MVTLAILGTVGFRWYARPMTLLPEATLALASTPSVAFAAGDDGRLTYTPITGAAPDIGLVFYPGALVPPAAYAPAALALAEAGFLVVVVPMPFNLAVFDIDAAAAVIRDHPKIETWAIAGHSLGGAMAAQFIDSHPGTMAGLALWAAYSAADLADDRVRVVNSYGTLDRSRPPVRSRCSGLKWSSMPSKAATMNRWAGTRVSQAILRHRSAGPRNRIESCWPRPTCSASSKPSRTRRHSPSDGVEVDGGV